MTTLVLRPYQDQGIADIKSAFAGCHRAPLFVAPTGSGKSAMFAAIAHGAATKGNRVLVLSHRIELVDQISLALDNSNTPHGFIAAGYPAREYSCMIASVSTLIRRLDSTPEPQLIVVDEAHHARASTWETVLNRWPKAKRIGFTATPIRASGEGMAGMFDVLVRGPTVEQLTPQYLAPARIWAPPTMDTTRLHMRMGDYVTAEAEELANKPAITGDAISHYRKLAAGKPALVFCVSLKHAEDVAAQFRAAGYTAIRLDGGTDKEVRRMVLKDFKRGAIQIIVSVEIFVEGVDLPGVHCGVILRPTTSLGMWRQMCGRIIRPCEGKEYATIIDHANNCATLGRPIDEPEWQLTYDEVTKKAKSKISVRICLVCFEACPSRAKQCSQGHPFPVEPREVEEREGELEEITAEELARRRERQLVGSMRTLEQLREYGRKKGYHKGWAEHRYAARLNKARA